MSNTAKLFEGLEQGDLARLIHPQLHIDEFKSKMGADKDIIVLSFKVDSKEPAKDLMSFIERGYDWVLDADVSSGEMDNGEYLVFVELERDVAAPKYIDKLVDDILNLTDQDIADWKFRYAKNDKEYDLTLDNLYNFVPLTVKAYHAKFPDKELDAMKENARVPMHKKAAINEWTDRLRVAAGLK
jgi:hypothetical protein